VGGVEGFVGGGFEFRDVGVELAGDDLFGGCSGVTEFAGREIAFFRARGWAEGAAEDGACRVEVAGAGGEIEDRAGLVVGELFEEVSGLLVFAEDAIGGDVAGVASSRKPRVEAGEGSGDSFVDSLSAFGVGLGEEYEAFAEAGSVLLRDGEDANAALCAAGAADEVRAAAESGGEEGGVDDLDEVRHGLRGTASLDTLLSAAIVMKLVKSSLKDSGIRKFGQ
jgi:hypothetical protein